MSLVVSSAVEGDWFGTLRSGGPGDQWYWEDVNYDGVCNSADEDILTAVLGEGGSAPALH